MVGRTVFVAAAFLLVLSGLAAAHSPPMMEQKEPPRQEGIRGMVCVLDPSNHDGSAQGCFGAGIPGATVHVLGHGVDQTVQADSYGNYWFEGAPAGAYTLKANRTGFEPAEAQLTAEGSHDISLHPQKVTLAGRLTDGAGHGVASVSISLCCSYSGSSPFVSGPDGNFSGSILAGSYSVSVQADGFVPYNGQHFVDGAALPIALRPLPSQSALVRGTVTDQDGKPAAGIVLIVDQYQCCGANSPDNGSRCGYEGICIRVGQVQDEVVTIESHNRTQTDGAGHYTVHVYPAGSVQFSLQDPRYAGLGDSVWVPGTEPVTFDIHVVRFAERDVRLSGRVVDATTGHGIATYTVSAEQLQFSRYECSQDSRVERYGGSYGYGSTYSYAPPSTYSYMPAPPYRPYDGGPDMNGPGMLDAIWTGNGDGGCAIRILPDGSFAGNVTAGFTRIRVDAPQQCTETQDAGGSFHRTCGPEYMPLVISVVLTAGNRTELVLRMQPEPAPDAVVSGYLVDGTTHHALPFGHIEFNNEQVSGQGYASTDGDGSFRIRLRSGYHTVTARVDGYFEWQGTILVAPGENPFDVTLTPGRVEGNGGGGNGGRYSPPCCMESGYTMPAPPYPDCGGCTVTYTTTTHPCDPWVCARPMQSAPSMAQTQVNVVSFPQGGDGAGSSQDGQAYVDLGGNLGPYDPVARSEILAGTAQPHSSPALPLLLVAAALIGALVAIRRRL